MPEVIKDRSGSEKIPSVVYWGAGGEVLVGEAALARLSDAQHEEADSLDAMQRIVKSVKRDLRHNRPRVLPDGRLLKPVDTVAVILGYLKQLAESAAFHEAVDTVVLTHPVKMTQREKELLDEAARKAGFLAISFKEEPVAAAHGYLAHGAKVGGGILVFDLGGGTLDLAFLQRDADGLYRMPVECMGYADCGGDDYDQFVYDHWEGQLQSQYGRGFAARNGEINPYVLLECRKAKEKLTDMQTARLSFLFRKDGHHEQALFALTRKEFDALSAAYVQKAVEHTRRMLKRIDESGLRVDTVLLIGGATRMPLLREELKAVLPVALTETMYADVAVALGGMPKAAEPTLKPMPALTPAPKPAPMPASQPKPREPESKTGDVKTIQLPGGVPLELVWIGPGSFVMGSPEGETGHSGDETQHRVTLTKGFWLGKYSVTQRQWQELMGNNPSHFVNGRVLKEGGWFSEAVVVRDATPECPVEQVSWEEAVAFCSNLSDAARAQGGLPPGYAFGLPTEAQWEYACRAGTDGPYGGTRVMDGMGWYDGNSGGRTHPVGQKKPNAWGLYDMHGNVWEWCRDWYTGTVSGASVVDPAGPSSGSSRVGRGGSWDGSAAYCRSALRDGGGPGYRNNFLGFRLALSSVP